MAQDYMVKAGDCVSSLAFTHGFFWETLWNHPKNSGLKSNRKDPNILLEGDVIHIPDIRSREESGASEARHRFKLKGVPAKLRLRFLEEKQPEKVQPSSPKTSAGDAADEGLLGKVVGAVKDVLGIPSASAPQSVFEDPDPDITPTQKLPRKNVSYILNIDGNLVSGKTDGQGYVQLSIPPNAKEGSITLAPGTLKEIVYPLKLGHLDPITENSGIIQRLAHLGYRCQGNDQKDAQLHQAVQAFQQQNELQVTGEIDDQTRKRLEDLHGS